MNLTHAPDQIPAAIARIDERLRDIATKRAATIAHRDGLLDQISQCDQTEDFLTECEDVALARRAALMSQMEAQQ